MRVLERDVFNGDFAAELVVERAADLFAGAVHDNTEHLHRQRGLLVLVNESDDADQRRGDASGEHLECDQRTDRERSVEDRFRAEPDHRHEHRLFKEVAERARGHGDFRDAEVARDRISRRVVPFPLLAGLKREGFDSADAVDRFHEHSLPLAFREVELFESHLERLDERGDHERHHERECENHDREFDAVDQQERQENHEREQFQHGEEQASREERADFFRLLHVLDEHAGGDAFIEVDRQTKQFREGARRQTDVDAVRREQKEVVLEIFESGVEQEHDHDAESENGQRVVAFMHENLVDDQLEENRNCESDEADRENCESDLAEQCALAVEFRNEPAQPERLIFLEDRIMLLEEHEFAGEFLFEIFPLLELHPRLASVLRDGVPDGDLEFEFGFFRLPVFGSLDGDRRFARVLRKFRSSGRFRRFDGNLADSADDDGRAVFFECDCGIRRAELREFLPGDFDDFRREFKVFRHLAEETARGLVFGNRVFVNQPADVGVAAVVLDDRGEAVERGMAAVDGASGEFDFNENGVAFPCGVELFA